MSNRFLTALLTLVSIVSNNKHKIKLIDNTLIIPNTVSKQDFKRLMNSISTLCNISLFSFYSPVYEGHVLQLPPIIEDIDDIESINEEFLKSIVESTETTH